MVPRLWHYGGGLLTHLRTQHLCPFCGSVLYETGGGIKPGCLVLLLSPLLLTALALLMSISTDWLR